MINYSADISEVIAILNSTFEIDNTEIINDKTAISKMTVKTENDFLDGRASAFEKSLDEEKLLSLLSEFYCKKNSCKNCPVSKYCNTNILQKINNYDHEAPVLIDLFCGAGGLSLGFTQEGFITSLANDIEPCCVDTYAHNHPETPRENIVLGDINDVIANIKSLSRFSDVDVIVGGPPCQGFSMANRQRIIDDPRNRLYKSYVKVVDIIKPKFFVMENVKGMLTVAKQVIEDFKSIGYSVSCRIFNACNFGVPQNRERLIFVGNRLGIDNDSIIDRIFESGNNIPSFVLSDALYGLRPLKASRNRNSTEKDTDESGRKIEKNLICKTNDYIDFINQGKKSPVVYNHKARYNNDRDIEIYGRLYQGDRSDDPKIADIMPYSRRNGIFKDKYFKLEENKICKTITAHMKFDCNMYIHPNQARGLTPREAARIQSYPDDYFFRGAYTKTYMQIGNSVPPLLGRAIAKVIKEYIKED